jgi:tetratricopeptide (TPR) repeat protein
MWFSSRAIWHHIFSHSIKRCKKVEEKEIKEGKGRRCPYCAEIVKKEATVCRFCGNSLVFGNKSIFREYDTIDIPDGPEIRVKDFVDRGMKYYREKDYDEAIVQFSRAIVYEPQNKSAYYCRAVCFYSKGYKNSALGDFKIAARLGHNKAQNLLNSKNIKY